MPLPALSPIPSDTPLVNSIQKPASITTVLDITIRETIDSSVKTHLASWEDDSRLVETSEIEAAALARARLEFGLRIRFKGESRRDKEIPGTSQTKPTILIVVLLLDILIKW